MHADDGAAGAVGLKAVREKTKAPVLVVDHIESASADSLVAGRSWPVAGGIRRGDRGADLAPNRRVGALITAAFALSPDRVSGVALPGSRSALG